METPMIWREPKDHTSDCYFCSVDLPNFRSVINASKCFNYPQNIESAILPTFRDMNIFVDSHVDNKTVSGKMILILMRNIWKKILRTIMMGEICIF